MRAHLLDCIVLAITVTAVAVVTGPMSGATHMSAINPTILNGCVQGSNSNDRFMFSEFAHERGTSSRSAGAQPHASRRINILGGFRPSTNIAAQAGALDPTQAAMAESGGIGVREAPPLVEVPARSVRPLFCPQP
jgi:hypothetical protein